MKILYLCKRHYMGHDVIEDRYARLYEQPSQLAQNGNELLCICLSYRPCNEKNQHSSYDKGAMHYLGFSPGPLRLSALRYPFLTLKHATAFKPDLIVASSDCLHVILGQWIAQKLSVSFAADLYDDYESFGLSKLPLIKYLYRRALKKAQVISCVSKSLEHHIKAQVDEKVVVCTMPSTIDKGVFFPRDKIVMRKKFNLPTDKKIIGTAGALTKEKGIDTVYKAFISTLQNDPNVHIALAGITDDACPPPSHERVHYLGKLPHAQVADFIGALDVGVVYLRDTTYGRLSFPQKAYEMAACEIPMVVSSVGDMTLLFQDKSQQLYHPENAQSLVNSIQIQLERPHKANIKIDTWSIQAKVMNDLFANLLKN